jgi:acetyltransferase-like isoleucine patch superfamily enzyme
MDDIPKSVVAYGLPAKIIKKLNPSLNFYKL